MIFLDCTHTSHCLANTGIQRVTRSLYQEGQTRGWIPVVYDRFAQRWRSLDASERRLMEYVPSRSPSSRRSSRWSLWQKLRGRLFASCGLDPVEMGNSSVLLAPEIFDSKRFASFRELQEKGVRVAAVFHDAIPLAMPQLTPRKTVDRFGDYLRELGALDHVFAVSRHSLEELEKYWLRESVSSTGTRLALPLAVGFEGRDAGSSFSDNGVPRILTVGSIEGRKNHEQWLRAAERLWQTGHRFQLNLIGMLNRETGLAAEREIRRLQAAGHPLNWEPRVSDEGLIEAYRKCDFTVYPSLYEGFGLPILESLSFGKPCVCLASGATGEVAALGGCVTVDEVTAEKLSEASARLLVDEELRRRLEDECRRIVFKTWTDYADEIEERLAL